MKSEAASFLSENRLTIYPAGVSDAEMVATIGRATFEETWAVHNTPEDMALYLASSFSLNQIRADLADPGNTFFLASYKGEIIGYAKLRTAKTPEPLAGTRCIEIERMYLLQAAKGNGIGSALMDVCLNYAKSNAYEVVWLGVWGQNPAMQFYQKHGFSWFGYHTFALGTAEDRDELMKRNL